MTNATQGPATAEKKERLQAEKEASSRQLFALLPCYNEEPNLLPLLQAWQHQAKPLAERGYRLSLVVIDDCSTDGTVQAAQAAQAAPGGERISLIRHSKNLGLVGGLNSAIHYFLENSAPGDLLALMDGDNTHDPKYILPMLDGLEKGKDCVIASRYEGEAGVVGVPRVREALSDFARYYYRMMLRVPGVEDYTCGYRLYTRDILLRLVAAYGRDPIHEKTFACMMELLYKLHLVGASFGEVGFTLRYDYKGGQSKMSVWKTAKSSLITALRLRIRGKRDQVQP